MEGINLIFFCKYELKSNSIECIIIIRLIFELKYYTHLISFVWEKNKNGIERGGL
jgi:hypothetical protein